jgi:hypothetical protein
VIVPIDKGCGTAATNSPKAHAVQRQRRVFRRERNGLGDGVALVAQRDKDRRIAMAADALIAARHNLRRRRHAGAMRGDDLGCGLGVA